MGKATEKDKEQDKIIDKLKIEVEKNKKRIEKHPMESIGIAMGVGVVIGFGLAFLFKKK